MVSFTGLATAALLASTALANPHGHGHSQLHQKKRTAASSSKRGAAYNDASVVEILTNTGTVSWAYDWNYASDGTLPEGIEYVPMLWGAKMFGGWDSAVQSALAAGSTHILGFNEPDEPSQANMPVDQAVGYFRQYITPYGDRATLVSPAVTNGPAPMGLSYLDSFLASCSNCNVSAMAVHWYGNSADEFKSFVGDAVQLAQQHNLPEVWITEFSLNDDSTSATTAFLQEVIPWLDAQPVVGRYAYFMCGDGHLLSGNVLSDIGHVYVQA